MNTSRTFCNISRNISFEMFISLQEQFYIMKPKEATTRSFKLYLNTDQAAKYTCAGMMKYQVHMAFLVVVIVNNKVVNVEPQFMQLCLVAAILKDSGFSEVDRAECQFTTTATIIDNGSQV